MKVDEETLDAIILAGASLIVGRVLHMAAKETWKKAYNEDPPALNPSEEIDWGKAILWSVATGTVISGAKLFAKRYIMIKRHG